MIHALDELLDFVGLIAFLDQAEEFLVVLSLRVEQTCEHFEEGTIDRFEKVVKVYGFKATEEVCTVRVLIHVEHMECLVQCLCEFLNDRCLASSCFTNEEHGLSQLDTLADLFE